ncbi:hypothetical protein EVAR_43754_1 [Eumeta japonica]|uniref:Uncharacterized protein n=1 Tax=Eumeta variegata TaxID=151549 RepID=A0A4C1XGJ0_EUMVA|nr:hypothetical protein EVAR_43754_1 [Eumeta japonica]
MDILDIKLPSYIGGKRDGKWCNKCGVAVSLARRKSIMASGHVREVARVIEAEPSSAPGETTFDRQMGNQINTPNIVS